MADDKASAPALDTNIESGKFDEKAQQQQAPAQYTPAPKKVAEDEDEEEDIDALIEDLESQDGHADPDEEEEEHSPGGGRVVPEEMLQTDSRVGLTESEVVARRRKYGLNQMKEEKENLILKFFSYFIGPIQFVMEVSFYYNSDFCAVVIPPTTHYGNGFWRLWFMTHDSWPTTIVFPCRISLTISIPYTICIFFMYRPFFGSAPSVKQLYTCVWLVARLRQQSQNSQWAIVFVRTAFFFARFFFCYGRRRLRDPHELGWADSNWLITLAGSMWRRVDADSGSGFGGVREASRSIRRSRLHLHLRLHCSPARHVPTPAISQSIWLGCGALLQPAIPAPASRSTVSLLALFPSADRLALHLLCPRLICLFVLPCANRGLFVLSRLPLSLPPVSRIGSISVSFALSCCLTLVLVSSKNSRPDLLSKN